MVGLGSETWYPLNGHVYLGKLPNETREANQGQKMVKDVTRKWLNIGRNITTDNFLPVFRWYQNCWL
jgi:hypothetical protein